MFAIAKKNPAAVTLNLSQRFLLALSPGPIKITVFNLKNKETADYGHAT
jgi:hypothetical protein